MLSGDELQKALAGATDGLLFPSESDEPIRAVVRPSSGRGRDLRRDVLALKDYPDGTRVSTQSADRFFAPAVEEKDWFGPEETERARRFRELLELLKANLKGLRAYRVGGVTADVYVLGRTSEGEVAGIATAVVET